MDPKVYKLLNDQINKEFYSAYLYLEIANYYDAKGLDGFANWYEIQAREEQDHAMLFYRYLHNNSQPVVLEGIARPETHFTDLIGPLKAALGHEQYVTGLINAIYAAAAEARDYRTVQFLDWFIKEQGEENDMVDRIAADPAFGMTKEELTAHLEPSRYIGRCPEQVEEFLTQEVQPVLEKYAGVLGEKETELKV